MYKIYTQDTPKVIQCVYSLRSLKTVVIKSKENIMRVHRDIRQINRFKNIKKWR